MIKNRDLSLKQMLLTIIIVVIGILDILSLGSKTVYADENEMFDFEAFIRDSDVKDGTGDFEANNEPGNDENDHNGIVRSFDSVTYPIKVTINPKKVDVLKNIKIKISGDLNNGVTNDRLNARFAVGGTESLTEKKVAFEQIYTLEQTGNSVMIPVTVEVKGALNGTVLSPNINVDVISVDGKDISKDKIHAEFKKVRPITVSSKVNVSAKMSNGYVGTSSTQIAYNTVDHTAADDDLSMLYQYGISFDVVPLPGRTSLKGATFPEGKLNFKLDFSGKVVWDDANVPDEMLDFENKNEPLELFSYQNIDWQNIKEGKPNTLSDKLGTFTWHHHINHSIARSSISDISDYNEIKKNSYNSVWDSGEYSVSKSKISKGNITINGSSKNFVIGSTFPEYRADGWRGSKAYGANEKAFSTQMFIIKSANEYTPLLGKKNTQNKANNVYYYIKVSLVSYEDLSGKTIPLTGGSQITMTERNNPAGSYSMQTTFHGYPNGKELGTPVLGYSIVSKGDPSVVLGQDVRVVSDLNAAVFSYGGGMSIYKWNVDSFELTENYANIAKNGLYNFGYTDASATLVKNDKKNQHIYYGVPKNKDMSFSQLTKYGKDDYTWYENYSDAIKEGKIGAIKNEVTTTLGTGTILAARNIPLKVTTKKIGSENETGTHNITTTKSYVYRDKDRKYEIDVKKDGFTNPTLYDELGSITKLQAPVGSTINFETLGILNAEVSTSVSSDKTTYYNSEKVHWTVKSNVVFPQTAEFGDEDNKVVIKQVLEKGLTYVAGSSKLGDEEKEPKITNNEDGTTSLEWEYLMSIDNKNIPNITYTTSINPFALDDGVQTSQKVRSIISSSLDTRKENLRTSSASITITKVGMVGIYEDIDNAYGGKNSEFNLTINPYTTVEDEKGVKGITLIPKNKDQYGSEFSGSAILKNIEILGNKKVSIYLNNKEVDTKNPNSIDVKKDGWYKYEKETDISNAKSVYFVIDELLTNKDNVKIKYTIATKDNAFGDIYYNETTINSDTNYKLSPISNRVNYRIRANVELSLKKIQIYTKKAEKGLPVNVNINTDILNELGKNEKFSINIYNMTSGKKVVGQEFKAEDAPSLIKMTIPNDVLNKNESFNYEARIEGYNKDTVQTLDGEDKVNTDGYTASEETVTANDKSDTKLEYKGVVMTEREVGKDMKVYYETLSIPVEKLAKTKSGYGITLNNYDVTYRSDLGNDAEFNSELLVSKQLVDETLDLQTKEGFKKISLDKTIKDSNQDDIKLKEFKYELPTMWIRQGDGAAFLEKDKQRAIDAKNGKYNLVDGGKKLYIPIWIDKLGKYPVIFKNDETVGINAINFRITNNVNVYAYMYTTIGSETVNDDELLLEPVYPDSTVPKDWTESDINWLKE